MRLQLVIATGLLLVSTVGCETAPPSPVRTLPQDATPIDGSAGAAGADPVASDAPLIGHAASGIVFPLYLGDFKRGEVTHFADASQSVGVAYTRHHLRDRLNLTIFVHPAPPALRLESSANADRERRKRFLTSSFDAAKQAVIDANPGTIQVMQDETAIEFLSEECDALVANFEFTREVATSPIKFGSTLVLFTAGGWVVKTRLTAPLDSTMRSLQAIQEQTEAFMQANDGKLLVRRTPER